MQEEARVSGGTVGVAEQRPGLPPEQRSGLAERRLIREQDLVPCRAAFIDCILPGSEFKENYSIIGAGVTQSEDQFVNLQEPHGFQMGVAAMPHGVNNNLHMHYTAEVFMVYRGEWTFRWGAEGKDGELVGRAGDIISMPTWIFRGFTNSGPDDSWIFTLLGRDESGGVVWHPEILRRAAEHGLYLSRENYMIDTRDGKDVPHPDELVLPLTPELIASMQVYSVDDMRARAVMHDELVWSNAAFLDSVLPGHAAELAPVIGAGMTADRRARARITNPHGFTTEWMRVQPGQTVGPFMIEPKQILVMQKGALEVTLDDAGAISSAVAEPWGTFAMPAGVWRTLRSVGDEPALLTVTTTGDARPAMHWPPETVAAAREAGVAVDPDGYLAPARFLPHVLAA